MDLIDGGYTVLEAGFDQFPARPNIEVLERLSHISATFEVKAGRQHMDNRERLGQMLRLGRQVLAFQSCPG